jgi:integrase
VTLGRAFSGMAPWVLHDLRRTARSLMSRADVLPHVSERVLGHAIPVMRSISSSRWSSASSIRRAANVVPLHKG